MRVCAKCFNDTALKTAIETNGETGVCDITGEETRVIDTVDLSDSFDSFIGSFVESESGTPFYTKIQTDWNLFSNIHGQVVFQALLDERNSKLKLETKVDYSPSIYEAVNGWQEVKKTLINEFRYMTSNKMAKTFDIYDQAFAAHVRPLRKDTILFRSRINENGDRKPFPKDKMGAPPKQYATAGRANPQGIPFLYLSDKPETTFYEARALFLDLISTGSFKSNREQKIVDFTETKSPFTFMADSSIEKGIIGELLIKSISNDLSRPMRRYDSIVDYVPTQFICEYIKYTAKADGIAFKSSLCDGVNYVIFDTDSFDCDDLVTVHKIGKVVIEEEVF